MYVLMADLSLTITLRVGANGTPTSTKPSIHVADVISTQLTSAAQAWEEGHAWLTSMLSENRKRARGSPLVPLLGLPMSSRSRRRRNVRLEDSTVAC